MPHQTEAQKIDILRKARGPLIVWMVMIGFVAIYVLSTSAFAISDRARFISRSRMAAKISPVDRWAIFAFVAVGIASLIFSIWIGPWLYQRRPWLLICLPTVLMLIYVSVLPMSSPVLMVGTYPILTIESIIAYRRPQFILTWLTVIYGVLWIIYFFIIGWWLALITLQSFVFVMAIVFYYWRFYQNQIAERQRLEDLYNELQLAYKQVEASAIRTERQRVARELHDTLTQGLAGVVMQLEAASSFLEQGKTARAKEIIDNSALAARDALQQSRITLTDLRSTTEESLPARLQLVAQAIQKNYQINTTIKLSEVPDYSPGQLTEITRIVTEALTNIAKHAATDQAVISSQLQDDIFKLKIIDFGKGFNTHTKQKIGHYGLQGLQERAERLGGVVTVISSSGEGTTVTLTIPATRKELDEA